MLKVNALGVAGALVTGICYSIEALLFIFIPEKILSAYSVISHNLDLNVLEGEAPTLGSFFIGLVSLMVISYIGMVIFGAFYNKFAK